MRVAAIDIGTNTVLLLVADGIPGTELRAVLERATITRLGQGVDRARQFCAAALARTRECLEDYARAVVELGIDRLSIVGTSAMRDAGGGEEVCRYVRSLFGIDARVLTGAEEARLTFRGAIGGLAIAGHEDVAVFDIGGGSTEVVVGHMEPGGPRLAFGASYDVGSVRLAERHIMHDPPTALEKGALMRVSRAAFAAVPPMPGSSAPVGIAGTMTTLAAVSLGLKVYDPARVHGYTMQLSDLRRVVDGLAAMNVDERKGVRGMEPKRADVIVPGGMLALALLEHWATTAVRISDRGVRWGLAEELLGT